MQRPIRSAPGDDSQAAQPLDQRRGFIAKTTAVLFSMVACAAPAALGVYSFLNPLRRRSPAGGASPQASSEDDGLRRVASLDALPEGRRVTAAYLLAAAVAPDHDLTAALEHSELGIWNFYSPKDVGFLAVGTSVFGTMDRTHTRAAGAVGFRVPEHLDLAGKDLYAAKLHNAPHNKRMARAGGDGSHLGWARPRFAEKWLAPMILADVEAVRTPHYQAPRLAAREADRPASLSAPGAAERSD